MAKQINMPKLGVTMEEGRISAWRYNVGDQVEAGSVLVDIESDKLVNEYEAPESGILLDICADEGDVVPVGELICVLGEANETASAPVQAQAAPTPQASGSQGGLGQIISMPKLGVTMEEGRIASWRYNEGDFVEAGTVLVDIESDKLVNEYESPFSGILTRILGDEGDIIPVGEPICELGGGAGGAEPVPASVPEASPKPVPEAAPMYTPSSSDGPVKAVPMVRKFAGEQGIPLSSVRPSGYGGCVTMDDVKTALKQPEPASVPAPAVAVAAVEKLFRPVNIVPLTGMRGAVAKKMSQSNQTVPQGTQFWDVDATELLQLQTIMQPAIKKATGFNLSLTALLIKALGKALPEHPILNSVVEENQVLQYSCANIAVAVAVDNGLMTPVVRNAESLSLAEIVTGLRSLADKARNGALKADDLADGTFVLTNLGMYGTRYFTPLISPPQTVMLGVGKIEEEAVVQGSQIVARPILPLSITMDHRAIDGVPGAQFMSRLKELLETPWSERITDISF